LKKIANNCAELNLPGLQDLEGLVFSTDLDLPGFKNLEDLLRLTTPLNPIPFFILPLFEKCFFTQRRIGLMMRRMVL
jgi:hypothetical protein